MLSLPTAAAAGIRWIISIRKSTGRSPAAVNRAAAVVRSLSLRRVFSGLSIPSLLFHAVTRAFSRPVY